MRSAVVLASRNRPSPLASTNLTLSRGNGPGILAVVGVAIAVGASVVGTVVGAAVVTVVVAAGSVVVVGAAVDVVGSGAAVVAAPAVSATTDVDDGDSTTVTAESSTNPSLGCGRPAMATPATAPMAMTARTNGQDLRMRPVKLPADSRHRRPAG